MVNPDLQRDEILAFLMLLELYDYYAGHPGVFDCAGKIGLAKNGARRSLAESDYQFIRENSEYLGYDPEDSFQDRIKKVAGIFDANRRDRAPARMKTFAEIIDLRTKQELEAAGIELGTPTAEKLEEKFTQIIDPFSHPDDCA